MSAILGISAFYHDSAAALIVDGEIVAAAQEERFSRKKHDARYPRQAIDFVLSEAGLQLDELEYVAFYDKPFLKFERLLETYVAFAPAGFRSFSKAMPIWLREKLFLKNLIFRELKQHEGAFASSEKILFSEHHYSHAASAYYPSPFNEAIVLTIDGVGEWATTTVAKGCGHKLTIEKEIHFPHSLGLLYSAFTDYIGFRVNSGEYKVMGLAPYGTPRYKDLILDNLIDLKHDGSFRLDLEYFNYCTGLTMTNRKFADLFGQPRREPEHGLLTQFHMDVAASIQAVTEEVVLAMCRSLAEEYDCHNLCMAGGVALNCVANGKILADNAFKNVWVQPAAGDAGGALGAAYAAWHTEMGNARSVKKPDAMQGSYLGPAYSDKEISTQLQNCGAVFEKIPTKDVIEKTVCDLADGKAVGWFQGKMEFGARALGGRSIIADSRSLTMQKKLNLKVKFRESFRPFAPSVLREDLHHWFELETDSPYMLFVASIKENLRIEMTADESELFGIDKLNVPRSPIPAVTHVDYSARIQTVHKETNPRYHELIDSFKKFTGCPILVNTSFNVRGEPIVCTPTDAFRCFMGTELDVLVIENFYLVKSSQTVKPIGDYHDKYDLD